MMKTILKKFLRHMKDYEGSHGWDIELDLFDIEGKVLTHEQFVTIGKKIVHADICDKPPDIMRPDREQAGKLTFLKIYEHLTRYGQFKHLKAGGMAAMCEILDAENVGSFRLAAFGHHRLKNPNGMMFYPDSGATYARPINISLFGEALTPLKKDKTVLPGRQYHTRFTIRTLDLSPYPAEAWREFFYKKLQPLGLVSTYEPEVCSTAPQEMLLRSLNASEVGTLITLIDELQEVGYFRLNVQQVGAKNSKTSFSPELENLYNAIQHQESLSTKDVGIVIGSDGIRPL